MRKKRILARDVWYEVRTAVNNNEPLFGERWVLALFARVFRDTRLLFAFEFRGLRLEGACLSFYIKPVDGLQLPTIMKWLKQTFAVRFNKLTGRTGHIWGDRYWSRILEGEPPVGAGAVGFAVEDWACVAKRGTKEGVRPCLSVVAAGVCFWGKIRLCVSPRPG